MADYVVERYNHYVYEQMDPGAKELFFMGSPLPILLLLSTYLIFVRYLGPWWMKDKPAFKMEKPMLFYNIYQTITNGVFVYAALTIFWFPGKLNVICEQIDDKEDPIIFYVLLASYLFMWSRLTDLLDTVFMVLKKNQHQITFLHVYHHMYMGLGAWLITKYSPGGNLILMGTINSFIHSVMYFYYFLTAYDPSFKKSIWWKKYLTRIQVIQFIILIVQQSLAIASPSCNYPKSLLTVHVLESLLMLYLFVNFYIKTYLQNNRQKQN